MRFIINGSRGGKVNKTLENFALSAAEFFAQKLDISEKSCTVYIRLHNKTTYDKVYALTTWKTPRKCTIDLCMYCDWITCLAHEMVHVKQITNNQLTEVIATYNDTDQWNCAWYEKEATSLQRSLTDEFLWGVS